MVLVAFTAFIWYMDPGAVRMTLWLDRTGASPPGAPVTHALAVGVSRYTHLPSPEAAPSPAVAVR